MKMKYLLFTVLANILSGSFAKAQPTIQWQKSLGGTGVEMIGSLVQQTNDGGFIVAGYSESNDGDVSGNNGNGDYWIVKLRSIGTIEWQKSLGGSGNDALRSIQLTNDGGYIVAGFSESNDGDVSGNHGMSDYWVVKLNSSGAIEWQKSLGGTVVELVSFVQQTNDGGFIVAGNSYSNDGDVSGNHGDMNMDYWVVKLSSIGNIEWQKSLGGSFEDGYLNSFQQTNDGGYIVLGNSNSNDGDVTGNHGNIDFWVVKLTSLGILEWQKSLGGTGDEFSLSIQQTSDGGYIVAGESFSNDGDISGNHGSSDYWVVKLTSLGILEWQKSLGGTDMEYSPKIQQTIDGGFIVAGSSFSNDGDVSGNQGQTDCWVVKLTSDGTIEWQKSIGSSYYDNPNSIELTNDSGYIISGFVDYEQFPTNSDCWIVKLNSTGTIEWQKSLGGSGSDVAFFIQQTSDGGYIVAGESFSNDGDISGNHGNGDYWIVKLISCQQAVSTQPVSQTMNVNSTAQFVVSSSVPLATFQWQTDLGGGFQNLNSIDQYSGTANDTLTISNLSLTNNNQSFRCIISLDSSCSDTSAVAVLTVLNNTGINEVSQHNLFFVYPNPAQDIINVKAEAKLLKSGYVIYDIIGNVVLSGIITSENTVIEIGNLSGGIYLFSVGENFKQTFKLLKE
jgi:hypothetical protein